VFDVTLTIIFIIRVSSLVLTVSLGEIKEEMSKLPITMYTKHKMFSKIQTY